MELQWPDESTVILQTSTTYGDKHCFNIGFTSRGRILSFGLYYIGSMVLCKCRLQSYIRYPHQTFYLLNGLYLFIFSTKE